MKKLQVLTTAAAVLLALSGPSFAAKRTHHTTSVDPASSTADRSGAYYYGPRPGYEAYGAVPTTQGWSGGSASYGQTLPYPDRPYGDPDSW